MFAFVLLAVLGADNFDLIGVKADVAKLKLEVAELKADLFALKAAKQTAGSVSATKTCFHCKGDFSHAARYWAEQPFCSSRCIDSIQGYDNVPVKDKTGSVEVVSAREVHPLKAAASIATAPLRAVGRTVCGPNGCYEEATCKESLQVQTISQAAGNWSQPAFEPQPAFEKQRPFAKWFKGGKCKQGKCN